MFHLSYLDELEFIIHFNKNVLILVYFGSSWTSFYDCSVCAVTFSINYAVIVFYCRLIRMSRKKKDNSDDLALSLTGSQIFSPGHRPNSAKQLKRPNSLTDVRVKEKKQVNNVHRLAMHGMTIYWQKNWWLF